jgi:hypothetical protein
MYLGRRSRLLSPVIANAIHSTGEIPVKIRTYAITATALLALSAPYAASARIAPEPHFGKQAKVLGAVHHQTGKRVARVVLPKIIYVAPFQSGSAPVVDASSEDTCTLYMVDCTDEQNCDIWGFNCDLVTRVAATNDSQGTQETSSTSSSSGTTASPASGAPAADPPSGAVAVQATAADLGYDDC